MSAGTANCFAQVVEWAAGQAWSTGKVGLLGVSYYAGIPFLSIHLSVHIPSTCNSM